MDFGQVDLWPTSPKGQEQKNINAEPWNEVNDLVRLTQLLIWVKVTVENCEPD